MLRIHAPLVCVAVNTVGVVLASNTVVLHHHLFLLPRLRQRLLLEVVALVVDRTHALVTLVAVVMGTVDRPAISVVRVANLDHVILTRPSTTVDAIIPVLVLQVSVAVNTDGADKVLISVDGSNYPHSSIPPIIVNVHYLLSMLIYMKIVSL